MDMLMYLLVAAALICALFAVLALLAEPFRYLALALWVPASTLLWVAFRANRYWMQREHRVRTLWLDLAGLVYRLAYPAGMAVLGVIQRSHRLSVYAGVICDACRDEMPAWWDSTVDCGSHACGECDTCLEMGVVARS